jgi:hypothetical protein
LRIVLTVGLLVGAPVAAQEGICADVGLDFAKPAKVEWTDWIGAAGGSDGGTGVFALRAGLAADFEAGQFGHPRYGGPQELRIGPWFDAETTFRAGVLEGGMSMDLGQTEHDPWGDLALRFGGGATNVSGAWTPSASVTLTWGVRSVLGRYSEGGGCVTNHGVDVTDEGAPQRTFAHASGVRLFFTARSDDAGRATFLVGLELEPTFVLPPYSSGRLMGGRPD